MATMLRATSIVFSFGSRNVPETGEATESRQAASWHCRCCSRQMLAPNHSYHHPALLRLARLLLLSLLTCIDVSEHASSFTLLLLHEAPTCPRIHVQKRNHGAL